MAGGAHVFDLGQTPATAWDLCAGPWAHKRMVHRARTLASGWSIPKVTVDACGLPPNETAEVA